MTDASPTGLPDRARVVIIGGGVIGCSTAYHLAREGWSDVVLLEQGHLSGGTTWHAAGLVGPLRATEGGTRLVQYSAELYASLEAETGLATGYHQVGGVIVARTEDRMTALRRTAANAAAYDMECRMLTPAEAGELWPPMRTDDLLGGIWLPGDGKVNPTDLTQSLAKGARQRGVTVLEQVRVLEVLSTGEGPHRTVAGVRTDVGTIEAEIVVNCAGQWAKALGDGAGVVVPLHSAEHFYVVTEQVEGAHRDLPIMRDPDGYTYFKEEVGGLVVGGFEPEAKPWVAPDQIPYPFEFALLEEDWEHFSVLMESAMHRIPALEQTGIRKFYNGPESFTPDNQFLLGETPGLRGFFVGAGFNSVGIASAGGAGRALAEWIVAGEPTEDLWSVDVRRFGPRQADNAWLRSRVAEVLGLHYEVPWPGREMLSGRPQRTSALHQRLSARGARFGTRMAWERPLYFAPAEAGAEEPPTWGKPDWLAWSSAEQLACRTRVALFDQTSFSKYVVSGPGALDTLQWVCAADVDVAPDRAVYTPWLNRHGRYEADVTVTRTAAEEFLVVSSAATTVRDLDWLDRHRRGQTEIEDLTEDLTVIGVMGPRAPALLTEAGVAGMNAADFPFAASRTVRVAGRSVRATRMTYVGEMGWELLCAADAAGDVYDALSGLAEPLGGVDAGYHAIESLRLEKGYRAFGRELTADYTPVDAGLVFATALDGTKDFLGREALTRWRERLRGPGPRRRLVSFVTHDPDAMLWGGELVVREEAPVGQVTSVAWGATVGSCVGLAYLRHGAPVTGDWLAAGGFEVDVAGRRVGITPTLRAPLR